MSVFSRLTKIIKANANSALDSMEDPKKMMDQSIADMQASYVKAKSSVASVKAEEMQLEKRIETYRKNIEHWQSNAKLALGKGDEALAMQALAEKKKLETEVEPLVTDKTQLTASLDKLVKNLKAMEQKIENAKRKKSLLAAKMSSASAKEKMAATMSSVDSKSLDTENSFSRMEEKANKIIFQADAMEEINNEIDDQSLESQFASLGDDDEMAKELAKLKASMKENTSA